MQRITGLKQFVGLAAAATLGVLAGALLVAGGGFATVAEAQSNKVGTTSTTTTSHQVITYTSTLVRQVSTQKKDEPIRQVYAFPNSPVFLTRTDEAIQVWERRDNTFVSLQLITLNEPFRDLIFLDDNRTFVIHTRNGVAAYSINQVVTTVKNGNAKK